MSRPVTGSSPKKRLDEIGIDVICEHIYRGLSLRKWCMSTGLTQQTVTSWIDEDESRRLKYKHAQEGRADFYFDELCDVSELATKSLTMVEINGLRLKSDNIKWMLARMDPKRFSEKFAIGGTDDLPPIKHIQMSADELIEARRMIIEQDDC